MIKSISLFQMIGGDKKPEKQIVQSVWMLC